MPKSNIDIKNIVHKIKSFSLGFGEKIVHYGEFILIVIFILMAACWVFLFWKYAYYVSSTEPQAPPAIFTKVRRTQLDQVATDIEKREQNRSETSQTQAINIFEDKTVASESAPTPSPGFLPE